MFAVVRGQRQKIDENLRLREKRAEPAFAVQRFDTRDGLRRAAPPEHAKVKSGCFACEVGAEHAQPHHADGALRREDSRKLPPLRAPLLLGVPVHVAMKVQHPVQRVLRHLRREPGVHHACDRHARREIRIVEDVVHARAQRENRLQARQALEQTCRGLPHQGVIDLLRTPDIGPDAEVQLRNGACERNLPRLGRVGVALKQDPHWGNFPYYRRCSPRRRSCPFRGRATRIQFPLALRAADARGESVEEVLRKTQRGSSRSARSAGRDRCASSLPCASQLRPSKSVMRTCPSVPSSRQRMLTLKPSGLERGT